MTRLIKFLSIAVAGSFLAVTGLAPAFAGNGDGGNTVVKSMAPAVVEKKKKKSTTPHPDPKPGDVWDPHADRM